MAANQNPIFPNVPYAVAANLSAVTACSTRGPTVTANLAAANIIILVPTSTNGCRIDSIEVAGASTSMTATTAAMTVMIWLWDGTTAWLYDEIVVAAQIPSAAGAPAFKVAKPYANLVLPAAFALYVSTSVTTTASTTAVTVTAHGGLY